MRFKNPVSHHILRYLADHPDAQDTASGIAEWWILERTVRTGIDEVQAALAELEEHGLVRVETAGGSGARYSLNPARRNEVRALSEPEAEG